MRWLSEVRSRLVALFGARRADGETAEEIRFHVEMEARKHEAAGVPADEARRRALVAFGGITQAREDVREARGMGWLEDFGRDLVQAARQFRRNPGFSLIAILTLALGIGANTAIFSVLDGVLLRPVPFEAPRELVTVWETDRKSGTSREPGAWPDYVDFKAQSRTLVGLEALVGFDANLTPEQGEPVRLGGVAVTAGYFRMLGIDPIVGRHFEPSEAAVGGPRVILIGERLWRTRYAADRGIVGRSIRINDSLHTVLAVLPESAEFGLDQLHARAVYHSTYVADGGIDVWLPLQADERQFSRDTHPFLMLGRLAPSSSVEGAQRELAGIAAELERSYRSNDGRGVMIEPFNDVVFGPIKPILWLLVAAVALVLLVACVNVANLLLARGAVRAREVAVRGALGAGFGRLGRQFVTEAVLLAVLGAVAGTGLAYGGLAALLALAPADIPRVADVGIDLRVLGVTLVVSLAVGIVFGMVPTLQAARVDVVSTIRGESRGASTGVGRRRGREILVITELALSVMLVVGAGLMIRSFRTLLHVDPGFSAERILKAQYVLPASRYPRDFSKFPNWTEIQSFSTGLLERVRRIPGVESATLAGHHPLDAGFTNSFAVVGREGEAADWPEISVRVTAPGYFETLGVEVRQGRAFEAGDDANAPLVALINQEAADRFFPSRDPIGQQIRFWGIARRIIGVVANERVRGLAVAPPPAAYVSMPQVPSQTGVVLVRTAGAPSAVAPAVRAAIQEGDSQLAVFGLEPLVNTVSDSVSQRRFAMLVLGAFAAIALTLALIGVYGVLSYTTSQRTRELGIRVALGASRGEVTGLVVRDGLRLAALGVLPGLIGAAMSSRLLSGLLYGVAPIDPITYVAVPAAVIGAALIATWLPARRAGRVAPVEALRSDG